MKNKFAISIIGLSLITFVSCKKEGCTDTTATNYNSEAKKDDGSCVYPDPEPVVDPRDEYIGVYTVIDSGFGGGTTFVSASTYQLTISKDATVSTELDFMNLFNWGYTHYGTLNGNSLNLPSQPTGFSDPNNIHGYGSFGTNSINLSMFTGPGGDFLHKISGTK